MAPSSHRDGHSVAFACNASGAYSSVMRRNTWKNPLIMLGAAGFALVLSSCDSATETGLEKLIESQGGGDVDLDLGGDGFSIETEDGRMTVDADGNFVVSDADGNVVTGEADPETGEVVVESEDGSFSTGSTTELPEEWPSDVPEPNGLSIANATVIGSDTERTISVGGSASGAEFVESYASALQSAGFTEDSSFTADDTINNSYSNANWMVNVGFFGDADENQVTITVFSNG
jgi:hypothetical protein